MEKLTQWQRNGINTLVTPAINVSIIGKGLVAFYENSIWVFFLRFLVTVLRIYCNVQI
jgi:hypothetical protein